MLRGSLNLLFTEDIPFLVVVFLPRIRRPWPVCASTLQNQGALCRDKSRTLTVWAFLAAEGGANKVKRGLKNVTLSVECGPLTVGVPLSREDPHPRGTPLAEPLLARRI